MNKVEALQEPIQSPDPDHGFALQLQSVSPSLRRFSRRLTKDPSVGDDLVQDTLTKAWSNRHRFEVGTNFRAWIFRIARNHFLSGIQRNRRKMDWNPEVHENLLIAPPSQEHSLYEADLDTAISSLPPTQQQALTMVIRQGLSYQEAAGMLGIELGTFNSRVARGRAAVIAYFSDAAAERGRVNAVAIDDDEREPRRSSIAPYRLSTRPRYDRWKNSGSRIIG